MPSLVIGRNVNVSALPASTHHENSYLLSRDSFRSCFQSAVVAGRSGRGRATWLGLGIPRVIRPWAGGTVRLPGSPQSYDPQLRNHNLAVLATCCQHVGYGASEPLPSERRTWERAKIFPAVCKLMHKYQPRKSKDRMKYAHRNSCRYACF